MSEWGVILGSVVRRGRGSRWTWLKRNIRKNIFQKKKEEGKKRVSVQ